MRSQIKLIVFYLPGCSTITNDCWFHLHIPLIFHELRFFNSCYSNPSARIAQFHIYVARVAGLFEMDIEHLAASRCRCRCHPARSRHYSVDYCDDRLCCWCSAAYIRCALNESLFDRQMLRIFLDKWLFYCLLNNKEVFIEVTLFNLESSNDLFLEKKHIWIHKQSSKFYDIRVMFDSLL